MFAPLLSSERTSDSFPFTEFENCQSSLRRYLATARLNILRNVIGGLALFKLFMSRGPFKSPDDDDDVSIPAQPAILDGGGGLDGAPEKSADCAAPPGV